MKLIEELKKEKEQQALEESNLLKELEGLAGKEFANKAKDQLRSKKIEKGMEYYLESLQRLKLLAERNLQKAYASELLIWVAGEESNLQREIAYMERKIKKAKEGSSHYKKEGKT